MEEVAETKRMGPWWLPFLATPLGIFGFWLLHALGVLGPTPLWIIMILLGVTAALGLVVEAAA
ncbi:MAG: hypothetical protein QOI55_622, partial [Actinomycetota bacterium]|nr:hypothetical protein [Actinomycetota bacterium]